MSTHDFVRAWSWVREGCIGGAMVGRSSRTFSGFVIFGGEKAMPPLRLGEGFGEIAGREGPAARLS